MPPPYDPGVPDHVDRVAAAWRRERPDIDVSSVGSVTRIWRNGRHLERHRKERLEAAGLISRHLHPTDRRKVDVALTATGMALVDEVTGELLANESQLLDVLDEAEQALLRALLKKLLSTFE